MRATAWYDNSADNPANPDPTVDVEFREQSWHEMMIGYFDWVPARRPREKRSSRRERVGRRGREGVSTQ